MKNCKFQYYSINTACTVTFFLPGFILQVDFWEVTNPSLGASELDFSITGDDGSEGGFVQFFYIPGNGPFHSESFEIHVDLVSFNPFKEIY